MIIRCEECEAEYSIDERRIKPRGSKVRCSNCGHMFRVYRPGDSPAVEVITSDAVFPDLGVEDGDDGSTTIWEADAPGGEARRTGGTRWRDVTDKETIRRAKPPARTAGMPARREDVEEPMEEESPDEEGGFDWEHLEVGDDDQVGADPGDNVRTVSFGERTVGGEEEPGYDEPGGREFDGVDEVADGYARSAPSGGAGSGAFTRHGGPFARAGGAAGGVPTGSTPYGVRYAPYPRAGAGRRRGGGPGLVVMLVVALLMAGVVAAGAVVFLSRGSVDVGGGEGIVERLASLLPVGLFSGKDDSVVVSRDAGLWLTTRNGHIYVVSGTVTNRSPYIVNYVRVGGEFRSGDEKLYSKVVYAGNTFTQQELRSLSLPEIERRLERRNGDIDFTNREKLAGLNYGIKPGESVPFFVVFPSKRRILGLKYRVWVEDYERGPKVGE